MIMDHVIENNNKIVKSYDYKIENFIWRTFYAELHSP